MAWPDQDQRIGRELVDGIMHRRPSVPGHGLQFLHRQESSGLQPAIDQEILNALVGELEEIDTVAPDDAVFVRTHQFESALAPCHPVSSARVFAGSPER